MDQNRILLLKFVSVTCFLLSSAFTVMLMVSGSNGVVASTLYIIMAIAMQTMEILFGYFALEKSLPVAARAVAGVLMVVFLGASIFASTAFMQNQANETANYAALDSAEYKQAQESRNMKKGDAESIKAQIANIEQDKAKYQADRKAAHDAYPSDYITVKANHTAATAAQVDQYNQQIAALQSKVEGITGELSVPLSVGSVDVKQKDGYGAMFEIIAGKLNEGMRADETPWTSDSVSATFFFIIGVAFEMGALLAGAVAMLSTVSAGAVGASSTRVPVGFKPDLAPAMSTDTYNSPTASLAPSADYEPERKIDPFTGNMKPDRPIGFRPQAVTPTVSLSKTLEPARRATVRSFGTTNLQDVARYAEHIATHATANKAGDRMVAPGIRNVAKATGMCNETAKKAHWYLKQHGKISVDENANRTYLLTD